MENRQQSDKLREIVERIVSQVDPDKIILFGSRARRQNAPTSDYDVCIIKSGIVHRRKITQVVYRILQGIGIAVDVVVDTPEHYAAYQDNPFYIYHDISREGVVVFDKSANSQRVDQTSEKQFRTGS